MNYKYRILLLEDNELALDKLSRQLELLIDCKIDKVTNGKSAIDKFNNNHYDLIIADIFVPILSGLDFIYEIRKYNKNIPIIVTTACTDKTFREKSEKLNVNEFMIKPIFIKEILIKIKKLI